MHSRNGIEARNDFVKEQVGSLFTGICIGGLVSDSLYGAAVGGCLNLIFQSETKWKTQARAIALFAAMKYISQRALNSNYLFALSPFVIAGFDRECAKNFAILLFCAPWISPFCGKVVDSEIMKRSGGLMYEFINQLFQLRILQGGGFVLAISKLCYFSKELAKSLLAINALRQTNDNRFFIREVKRYLPLIPLFFIGELASALMINYITAQYFGDAKWFIPIVIMWYAMEIKSRIIALNLFRRERNNTILSSSHSIEIMRILRLIKEETETQFRRIEVETAQEIARRIQ